MRKFSAFIGLAIIFLLGPASAWGVLFTETFLGSADPNDGMSWYIGDQPGTLRYDAVFRFDLANLGNIGFHRYETPPTWTKEQTVNPTSDEGGFDPAMYIVDSAFLDFSVHNDAFDSSQIRTAAIQLEYDDDGDTLNNQVLFNQEFFGGLPSSIQIDLFDKLLFPELELGDGSLNVRFLNQDRDDNDYFLDSVSLTLNATEIGTPVPEPSTFVYFVLAITGFLGLQRKLRE